MAAPLTTSRPPPAPSAQPSPSATAHAGPTATPDGAADDVAGAPVAQDPGPLLIAEGIHDGTQPVEGDLIVTAPGILAPGHSPGSLPVAGDFHLDGGTLEVEIAGLEEGEFDQLLVAGAAYFDGGNLVFSFIDGFEASVGQTFNFLTAAQGVFGFDSVTLAIATPLAGLDFNVIQHDGMLELLIVEANQAVAAAAASVTAPHPIMLAALPLLMILGNGIRGRNRTQCARSLNTWMGSTTLVED